jgi:hypothetical protein
VIAIAIFAAALGCAAATGLIQVEPPALLVRAVALAVGVLAITKAALIGSALLRYATSRP